MTKSQEIEEFMLATLKEHGFEDTTQNRLEFLQGLQHAWNQEEEEDVNMRFQKALYKVALAGMIAVQQIKLMHAR